MSRPMYGPYGPIPYHMSAAFDGHSGEYFEHWYPAGHPDMHLRARPEPYGPSIPHVRARHPQPPWGTPRCRAVPMPMPGPPDSSRFRPEVNGPGPGPGSGPGPLPGPGHGQRYQEVYDPALGQWVLKRADIPFEWLDDASSTSTDSDSTWAEDPIRGPGKIKRIFIDAAGERHDATDWSERKLEHETRNYHFAMAQKQEAEAVRQADEEEEKAKKAAKKAAKREQKRRDRANGFRESPPRPPFPGPHEADIPRLSRGNPNGDRFGPDGVWRDRYGRPYPPGF